MNIKSFGLVVMVVLSSAWARASSCSDLFDPVPETDRIAWSLADKLAAMKDETVGAGQIQVQLIGLLSDAARFDSVASQQVFEAVVSIDKYWDKLSENRKSTIGEFLRRSSNSFFSDVPRSSWRKIPTVTSEARRHMRTLYAMYALIPPALNSRTSSLEPLIRWMNKFNETAREYNSDIWANEVVRLAFTNDQHPPIDSMDVSQRLSRP